MDEIKDRCVIDEETGCWHWRGAMSTDKVGAKVPVIWHEGRSATGMRVVYELARRKLRPGESVWRSCRCGDCIAPAHLVAGTKGEWGAWRKANGFAKISADAWAANMLARRRQITVKGDAEMAQVIKASDESGPELARRFAVSKSTVSRIRLGKTWAETVPQASVFTWRG